MAQSPGSYAETPVPDGIEAVPRYNHSYPEAVPSTSPVANQEYAPVAKQEYAYTPQNAYSPQNVPLAVAAPIVQEKKICGVRKTTFILSLLLALAVIGAAVGGGAGGTIAVNNAYE